MPSVLPHLLIPVLLALVFLPVERKRVLMWSPMALVPDLDYFFAREFHRAALSNIWIPLILIGVMLLLWRRRDPTARFSEWMWRPGAPGALSLSVFYLVGHILMDIFAGGVVLLWPLTEVNFYLFFNIVVDTATNEPVVTGEGGTEQGIPEVASNFEWWSTIDTAMATLTVVVVVAWLLIHWIRRRRDPPPVIIERKASSHKE